MEVTQFYLHLPSNSSLDKFPKNTLFEYRVGLPETIILSGDWEVALTDIHYPHSWNTFKAISGIDFISEIRNYMVCGRHSLFHRDIIRLSPML